MCFIVSGWGQVGIIAARYPRYKDEILSNNRKITLKNRRKTKLLFLTNTKEINIFKSSYFLHYPFLPKNEVNFQKDHEKIQ